MSTQRRVYVHRETENLIARQIPNYPILSIVGPRQSGKTELIRNYFPHLKHYDFEDLPTRALVEKDITGFVRANIEGAIFDEFQFVPEITQVLKVVADELIWDAHQRGENTAHARFIITGSHNYLLDDRIKEGMVGRVANIKLLPFNIAETSLNDPFSLMYKGGYPAIHTNKTAPHLFFINYIENYLNREVRTIHGIEDLSKFQEFMEICASFAGNFFDYDTVGSALGLKKEILDQWLMVLFSSYIIFFARPYHKSLIKQMAKNHKLYFYDTGLCASLMGVKSPEHIQLNGKFRGKLFENLIFSELWKKNFSQGHYLQPAYFWNITGKHAHEVDMIIEGMVGLKAVEIKSSSKFDPRWFANMQKHEMLREAEKFVVYTGPTQDVEGGRAINFCDLHLLFLE